MKVLSRKLGLLILVETGTYKGTSTLWAAHNFNTVVTIDICEDFVKHTQDVTCKGLDNVAYYVGDSRHLLPAVIDTARCPMAFWLDAHNSGQLFGGGPDDCPLMEELEAILSTKLPHAVLIDDAHCFMSPVTLENWPEMWQIKEIAAKYGYLTGIAHDAIAIVPQKCADELTAFASTNPAYLAGTIPTTRFSLNLQMLLSRKIPLKCYAHVIQGPPPIIDYTADKGNPHITEMIGTVYGTLLAPRFDTCQTYALRSGWAIGHAQIEMLIEEIKKRPPGAVFIDIGANIGCYGFGLRPYCSMVHMFEPQLLLYYMICGSIALNGFDNVRAYNYVMSDCVEAMVVPQFDYSKEGSFGSIEFGSDIQKDNVGQERQYNPLKKEYVTSAPLDQFTFGRVDMIKIDAEGMDQRVLDGAKGTIKQHKPILMVEHTHFSKVSMLKKLNSFGYINIRDIGGDYLCLPEP